RLTLDDDGDGKWMLLQTDPANPAQPARSHLVRVIKILNDHDSVLNKDITRLTWEQAQATPFELDMTVLTLFGNVIPVCAGSSYSSYFIAGADFTGLTVAEQSALHIANNFTDAPRAVERTGPNHSLTYLFTLPGTEQQNLVRRGAD